VIYYIGDKFITKLHFSDNIEKYDIVEIIDIYNDEIDNLQIIELYNETKNKIVKIYTVSINNHFQPIKNETILLIDLLELLLNKLL